MMSEKSRQTRKSLLGDFDSIPWRCVIYIGAVWLACSIGAAGLFAAESVRSGRCDYEQLALFLWHAPLLLVAGNEWMLLTLPLFCLGAVIFILSLKLRYRDWGVLIAVSSFLAMVPLMAEAHSAGKTMAAAWLTWAVLLVQTELGLWLLPKMEKNCALRRKMAREVAEARGGTTGIEG